MKHSYNNVSVDRRTYLKSGFITVAGIVGLNATRRTRASQDPAPTDTEIGGGDGYDRIVSSADADVVVSTRDGLLDAFDSVTDGDVVYVDDDAEIDLSERRITIPAGITLASGRGRDGSDGALITCDRRTSRLFQIYDDDVRITGLRFRGPEIGYYDPAGSAWDHNSLVLRAYGGCEIDNCEIYGWPHAGIGVGEDGTSSTASDAHVHHCSIHDNMMSSLGYGIVVYRGEPLIEYNYFNGNRHSIGADGASGCSYEARYNIQGPDGLIFGFEMHSPGGEQITIHHNTFQYVETRNGNVARGVAIRGTPSEGTTIENNWFYNLTDPGNDRYADGSPVVQYDNDAGGTEWDNVSLSNNYYGENEPHEDIGHPRTATATTGDERNVITIYGRGSTTYYQFSVSGDIEKSTADGGTLNSYDTIDGTGVEGRTTNEPDSYVFTGNVTGFDASSSVEVRMNGDVVDPSEFDTVRDVLTIVGRGTTVQYEFRVSGAVEKSTAYDATINSYDSVADAAVSGRTTREPDSYEFTGEITGFDASSEVDVTLNGEEIDLDID